MPQTTRPSALATGSRVRAGLQRGGQFARPHRFTTPRPDHPSAHLADSAVINFSITVVIINSMADNFWPNTSGDIHLKYILLVHIIFCQRAVYLCLGLQYC